MRHRDHQAEDPPAFANDNAPLPPERWLTRWTVRRGRTIALVLVGLAVAASLLSVYLTYRAAEQTAAQSAETERRLDVLEQDLAERRDQRDAERDAAAALEAERDRQLREQVGDILCDILADQPASRARDQARITLNCPPPPADPMPAQGSSGSAPAAPDAPAAPGPAGGGSPPSSTPPPSTPAPPPSAPPPGDDGLLCGLLPLVC